MRSFARSRSSPKTSTCSSGLPDTIWFPEEGFSYLDDGFCLSFFFPVDRPEFFDAVVTDEAGRVLEIQVKSPEARSKWVWGAFKMPARVFAELHRLWLDRERKDEYIGTLVNAYLERGGRAIGVHAGQTYVDVGTVNGYQGGNENDGSRV